MDRSQRSEFYVRKKKCMFDPLQGCELKMQNDIKKRVYLF